MKLANTQRSGLEATLRFHSTSPPTVGDLLRRDASAIFAHVLIGALLSAFIFAIGVPLAGALCFGMFLGAILRMIRADITYVRNWPLVDHITQWDLVEALVHPPAPVAEVVASGESQP